MIVNRLGRSDLTPPVSIHHRRAAPSESIPHRWQPAAVASSAIDVTFLLLFYIAPGERLTRHRTRRERRDRRKKISTADFADHYDRHRH